MRLTARGAKTRERIVATAVDLMRVRGIARTTLDDISAAGKVSKSQLYRHFVSKQVLLHAVIDTVGEETLGRQRALLDGVRSFAGLRRWRDAVVQNASINLGRFGCTLGALANEVSDRDEAARAQLERMFALWRDLFGTVLDRFRDDGLIPEDTDVEQLALGLVATVQGAYLLAQTARDIAPMASTLDVAISHLELLSTSGHDSPSE